MGGLALYPPHPLGSSAPPPIAASCIDFVINSQAELEALAPNVGNVHTLNQSGSYCWGSFPLDAARRIVVPAAVRQLHQGHGPSSRVVCTNIAGEVGWQLQAGAEVTMRDLTVVQAGQGYALDCATDAVFSTFAAEATQGIAFRHSAGEMLASNVNLLGGTGAACLELNGVFAESHWTNLRIRGVTAGDGVRVTGTYSSFLWVGGRIDNAGGAGLDAVEIAAGAGNVVGDVTIVGIEFGGTWGDAVQHTSGTVDRCGIVGNSAEGGIGTLVDWFAANIPAGGLTVSANHTFIPVGSYIQNHTVVSARCNYKGNTHSTGLFSETPIVP